MIRKTCKHIYCNGEMSRKNKVLISRIEHQAIVTPVTPILFLEGGGGRRVRPRLDPCLYWITEYKINHIWSGNWI
jgi:hypothetical protein